MLTYVLQANAQSSEIALALLRWNPSLRLTLQKHGIVPEIDNSHGRLTVQTRAPASTQNVRNAAVYILQLTDVLTLQEQLLAELKAHLEVLRGDGSTLIIALPSVPEPGSVHPEVEITARSWDLARSQLNNESDLEISDLENVINSVQDGSGKLVVVNKLRSQSSTTLALAIKYEPDFGDLYSAMPQLT
jgi:hypothetical protein